MPDTPAPPPARPFIPFGRPSFGDEEIAAVTAVMRSGWVGMGAQTLAFEKELAARCGAPHGVLVNSCTSALYLSLAINGVGPGDEVIVPSLTWLSTANVALHRGADVVFCDVDRQTLCATPESVAACLSPRTKAVVVVHMGGHPVDIAGVRAILPDGVALIEDAAHAMGGCYLDGTPVGSSGNLTCFSFYANKNLSTGDGGLITLADAERADLLHALRLHGLHADAWHRYSDPKRIIRTQPQELGYKMNYTDLQAAIGRVQLARFDAMQARRHQIAAAYQQVIDALPFPVGVQALTGDPRHALHLFVLIFDPAVLNCGRDDILLALRDRQIGSALHYAPMHTMPLYASCRHAGLDNTDWLADRILTLPISASIHDDDLAYLCQSLDEVLRASAT